MLMMFTSPGNDTIIFIRQSSCSKNMPVFLLKIRKKEKITLRQVLLMTLRYELSSAQKEVICCVKIYYGRTGKTLRSDREDGTVL